MKINILIILLSLITTGCQQKKSNINRFEENLPKSDLTVLDKLAKEFDQFIEKRYDGKIDSFLTGVAETKRIFDRSEGGDYCQLLEKFDKSTLEYKSEKLSYDTVYTSNFYKTRDEEFYSADPIFITVTQEKDTGWEDLMLLDEQTLQHKIDYIEKVGYWKFISESSFVNSLTETNIRNKNVVNYIEARHTFGNLNPATTSRAIRKLELDLDNYFVKRIIVFEIFAEIIKLEYQC